MYHYRARLYSPTLGRFLQTDPIGFQGGMNLYAYVRNDPVNFTDPSGLEDEDITVTGPRRCERGTWGTSNGGCTQNNKDLVPTLQPTSYTDQPGGGGGGRNPPPRPGETEETEEEREEDLDECRAISDAAARSRCYESANARDWARRHGRDLPPLITWREASALAVAGVIIYWIISVGSRFVFSRRNLVPIP